MPATEIARRAGHGVAVLLKIYAYWIDGQADAANQRITDALGTTEADQDPGGEGDAGSLSGTRRRASVCPEDYTELPEQRELLTPEGTDRACRYRVA